MQSGSSCNCDCEIALIRFLLSPTIYLRYQQRSDVQRRWRCADPASVITLDDHAGTVFGVSTIPGYPNLLASGGEDAILRLWNTSTTRVIVAEPSNNLSVRIHTDFFCRTLIQPWDLSTKEDHGLCNRERPLLSPSHHRAFSTCTPSRLPRADRGWSPAASAVRANGCRLPAFLTTSACSACSPCSTGGGACTHPRRSSPHTTPASARAHHRKSLLLAPLQADTLSAAPPGDVNVHKVETHDQRLEDLSVSELRVLLQPRMPAEDDLFHQLSKARAWCWFVYGLNVG